VYMSFMSSEANPLLTFNLSKFPNISGNAEKINKLRYYIYQYAKNNARNIYNEEVRDGEGTSSYDFDLRSKNVDSNEETMGKEDTHSVELENNMIFADFIKELKPTQRKVMILRYHGMTMQDIGNKLSLSKQRVEQILKSIKPQYTRYLQMQGVI